MPIIKKTIERHLPKDIIWRKKMGFTAPLGKWFLDGLVSLDAKDIWQSGATKLIHAKITEHQNQREDNRLFLWNIYMLTEFMRRQNGHLSNIVEH